MDTPLSDQLVSVADLELIELEELFNLECKCESKHIGTITVACSVTAMFSARSKCGKYQPTLICENLATANMKLIARGGNCKCKTLASECWTILSI